MTQPTLDREHLFTLMAQGALPGFVQAAKKGDDPALAKRVAAFVVDLWRASEGVAAELRAPCQPLEGRPLGVPRDDTAPGEW